MIMPNDEHEVKFGLPSIGIPAELLFHPELTMTERVLFGFLRNLSQGSKGCYASNKYLGGLLQVGTQTISNSLSSLKKWGFIEVEMIQKKRSNESERRIYINVDYPKRYRKMIDMIHDSLNENGLLDNSDYARIKKFMKVYKKSTNKEEREEERESKVKNTLSRKNCGTASVDDQNKDFLSFAERLLKVCQQNGKIKRSPNKRTLSAWAKQFRLLHTSDKVSIADIDETLGWFEKNINYKFAPHAYCGDSFREKYDRIINAIEKQDPSPKQIKPGYVAKDHGYGKKVIRINTDEL